MEFKDKIRNQRLSLGLTLEDIANKVGVSPSSIQRYESGEIKNVRRDKINKLAKALNLSPAYLMDWDENQEEMNPFQYENIKPIATQKIPLIGEIACGNPIVAYEELESYIEAGTNIKANYCLRCKGNSMINARIYDGDIVFIREQPVVNNGEIAAVIIDDEVTLKRVYHYKEKNLLILKPENPDYEDMIFTGEELSQIRILGKAVAFQSDVK